MFYCVFLANDALWALAEISNRLRKNYLLKLVGKHTTANLSIELIAKHSANIAKNPDQSRTGPISTLHLSCRTVGESFHFLPVEM